MCVQRSPVRSAKNWSDFVLKVAIMEFMEEIINAGLDEIITILEDNHITTLETAILLNDEDLKELIPKIGPRIKFKNWLLHQKATGVNNLEIKNAELLNDSTQNAVRDTDVSDNAKISTADNNTESLDGRAILKEGKGGLLTEGSRRKLSQLLIHHQLENNCAKKISNEEFYKLATEIVEIFHKERVVVYYSAYLSATNKVAKKNASGKLYESYIARRRKLRESGQLPRTSRSSSKSSRSSLRSTPTITDDDIYSLEFVESGVVYEETLLWLKNNVDPWKSVEEKWAETADHRLNRIQCGKGDIADYFKDFPALKQSQGYTLLMNDFSRLYPGKENKLFSSITLKKEKIIQYASLKLRKIRDKDTRTKIADIVALIDEDEPETSSNVALMLLAYVINISPARKMKGKPAWKPSRAEVCDGYISQAASEADVTNKIIQNKENLQRLGRTVQPYVIFVGPTVTEVDWRTTGFKPKLEEQHHCGACYAFAVTHALQAQLYRRHGFWGELSPQQIVDCSFKDGNAGCDGGSLRGALRYAARDGLITESQYPYVGKDGSCKYNSNLVRVRARRWATLPVGDEAAVEKSLATIGPLAVAVNAAPFTFQLYRSGIYDDLFCTSWTLNHAMLLVGYTQEYWILLNWWGKNWGEDGYIRIRRGLNRCGVTNMATYVEL